MDKESYKKILKLCDSAIGFFLHLVESYGEVKFIKYNTNSDENKMQNIYHDFIYYCFTKSSRSLFSALVLSEKMLREDSLIILRSVYENYLYISHTLNNPDKIQEYVIQTLGLWHGTYAYKKKKKGGLDYKNIFEISSGKEFRHGTSTFEMVQYGLIEEDKKVHPVLYKYLSEHTHPNMMGSGNYRSKDSLQYIVKPTSIYLDVAFTLLYLCYITLDLMDYYHSGFNIDWNLESFYVHDLLYLSSLRNLCKNELLNIVDIINFDERDSSFKTNIVHRINFEF